MKITKDYLKKLILEELQSISGGGEGTGKPTGNLAVAGVRNERIDQFVNHIESVKKKKDEMIDKLQSVEMKTALFPEFLPDRKNIQSILKSISRERLGEILQLYNLIDQLGYEMFSIYNDYKENYKRFDQQFSEEQKKFLAKKTKILFPEDASGSPLSRALKASNLESITDRMVLYMILEAGYSFEQYIRYLKTRRLLYSISSKMPNKMSQQEYRAWINTLKDAGDLGR